MSLTSYRAAPPRDNRSDYLSVASGREGEGLAGLAASYSSAAGAAVPSAQRVFTAEFGMGSGVWPLAMATRPAKGPIGWGVMWRGEVSWCEAAGPRFHGDLLPRWRGERGSWRWARAMMLVNQAARAI